MPFILICTLYEIHSNCSCNRCLNLFCDCEPITILLLRKLLQLVHQVLTPYLSVFQISAEQSSSAQTVSTASINALKLRERMLQTSDSLSIQDYQLVVKIFTIFDIHISTIESISTRLYLWTQYVIE